jgi:thiamine phosphate synthase YjbQ (UPF0047 family)
MRPNTKRRAIIDLTAHIEEFLDNFQGIQDFPHMPSGLAELMAEHAFAVLEVIEVDQESLRDEGMFTEAE